MKYHPHVSHTHSILLQDLINDYMCICTPGFTGKHCDMNIDDCQENSCQNGGQCLVRLDFWGCFLVLIIADHMISYELRIK